MADIQQQFVLLCQQAYEADLATDNQREVETILVELINLVKRHPEQRSLFVKLFSLVADHKIEAPEYLLPFCMRELRFPEIREQLHKELEHGQTTAQALRKRNFISHVMHAFDDTVWEDADMWPYYAHELEVTKA